MSMSDHTLTHYELTAALTLLRDELRKEIQELRLDMARLEAKIDSKPGLMAMFTGILVTVLGITGVIGTTIATLGTLGFISRIAH